jgi:hypothetical protein
MEILLDPVYSNIAFFRRGPKSDNDVKDIIAIELIIIRLTSISLEDN